MEKYKASVQMKVVVIGTLIAWKVNMLSSIQILVCPKQKYHNLCYAISQ